MKNACFEKITILELGFENMIFKKAIEYLVKSVKSVVTVKNCNVKMSFFDNLKKILLMSYGLKTHFFPITLEDNFIMKFLKSYK